MEAHVAIAKIRKYATSSSGDTVEVVERPHGGISIVMADGQSSGKGAKAVSNLVVRKVIALLAEGVRDGAAARAASDSLFTERGGKVSSTLNIVSIDQHSLTLVLTCNSPTPVIIVDPEGIHVINQDSKPIGIYRGTRPVITELPLRTGLTAVSYTDGLVHAGDRAGNKMDVPAFVQNLLADAPRSAQEIADALLNEALRLDEHRPVDDVSVVVVQILPHSGSQVRKMSVCLPFNS